VSHLLVDAMNVIGSRPDGWWRDRPGAIRRLARDLATYAFQTGHGIDLFVDGRELPGLEEGTHDGVHVWYARRAGPNAADDRIVEYVREHPDPPSLDVITSDNALAGRVRDSGARVRGASWLLDELERHRS